MTPDTLATTPRSTTGSDQIDVLKADVAAIRNDLRALGKHTSESARTQVAHAKERLSDISQDVKEKGMQARDQMETQITEHPFAAVGIALGAGLLLGMVLARR